jgi:PhnB protein
MTGRGTNKAARKEGIMPAKVKAIPDGYHTITPYLYVRGAARAIEFYRKVFGAVELFRIGCGAEGQIGHAEIRIGDSVVMLADEMPEWGIRSPQTVGGVSSAHLVYVEDVDAVFRRAIAAGATAVRPVENKFYGDRAGQVADPFGHHWSIATHVEDIAPEEIARRAKEEVAKMESGVA